MVITQIFNVLLDAYDGENTLSELRRQAEIYPELMGAFAGWLSKFCDTEMNLFDNITEKTVACGNKKIYGKLETRETYIGAIIDYISGMSDNYCIKVFNELITY